ncbi:MAG: 50S ribosomal protein L28 [Candidatus Pacebacteria bacterium]|jgi:ribosomal protein L28|nr:50S ribosomal protein L28 [Candidatus Paceibacterota bacterium]MBT4652764.1 50S ribosomal protein L28 [Candidatus Paceibacterota bacterium]MBT6755921.1 50S ribosomal protein L28 [Candidatus Paceibacterota bacterium]MBT6921134.1 50S ribosomal protein L28 [Candidatus Paceibacterota bacterium]
MKKFSFKFPRVAHIGNTVSHAKNRNKRGFKYNLHTVTVVIDGEKKRFRVPTKVLRMLKKAGVTTHYKKPVDKK